MTQPVAPCDTASTTGCATWLGSGSGLGLGVGVGVGLGVGHPSHLGVHGGLVLGGRQHAVDLKLHGVRRGGAAGAAAVALGAEPDQPPRGVGPDHRLAITLAGRPQPHEDADALIVASLGRRLARRARAGRWGGLRR